MTAAALLAFPALVLAVLVLRGKRKRRVAPRVFDSGSLIRNVYRGRR